MPVPVSGTFSAEFAAFEVMAKLPVTLPLAVGENFVLKLTLWPAVSVAGKVKPLSAESGACCAGCGNCDAGTSRVSESFGQGTTAAGGHAAKA